jgi:3-methylcrotonyl-CoA carboxylase alpha subunit
MEAMKMEHVISAPHAGTVSAIFVAIGQQVDNGAVLLTLDVDEGDDDESRT